MKRRGCLFNGTLVMGCRIDMIMDLVLMVMVVVAVLMMMVVVAVSKNSQEASGICRAGGKNGNAYCNQCRPHFTSLFWISYRSCSN